MCGVIAAVLTSVGSAGHNSRISSSCDEAARAHPAGVQMISRWPATWMPTIQMFEYTVARIDRYRCAVQQACAPRFAVCFGGVIAAPFMQHLYPASKIQAHSFHSVGDKDFVRKVTMAPG